MPDRDSSKDEKIYRFISDPRHKETLSGRVRAACVTCRRKKVKCDGEMPCNTCKDRGVHCEGLTERRRARMKSDARRTSDVSTDLGQYSPAASTVNTPKADSSQQGPPRESSTRRGASPSAPQRPALQKTETMSSDSGYSSGRQSAQHGIMPQNSQHFKSTQSTVPVFEYCSGIAEADVGTPDWSYFTPPDNCNQGGQDLLGCGDAVFAGLSVGSTGWTDPGVRNASWWNDSTSAPQSAAHLISAAKVLEEQARSLRRLASRQINETRRQTVTFPMALDDCTPAINAAGASDDMALLFADRTQTHGFPFTSPDVTPRLEKGSGQSTAIGHRQAPTMHRQTSPLESGQMIQPANTGWHYALDGDTHSSPKSTFGDFRELRPLNQNRFVQTHVYGADQPAIRNPHDCPHPWSER